MNRYQMQNLTPPQSGQSHASSQTLTYNSAPAATDSAGSHLGSASHVSHASRASHVRGFGRHLGRDALSIQMQPNWLLRTVLCRILGAGLVIGSIGLWLIPGAGADPELSLIRLGISIAFLFAGLILWTSHGDRAAPEVSFDPIRREICVLQAGQGRAPHVMLRRSYDSLGGIRFDQHALEVLEQDGSILMEVPVSGASSLMRLRQELSRELPVLA
ncbi:hypothetical protein [Phaeobacter sp.]|uniref:hypothetical protein n=1 Tax=Phaeobacter sp. TaxID=1902409 RepID=UPI0025E7BB42|nr:hypothetical protein [Phaeobacter sp.]